MFIVGGGGGVGVGVGVGVNAVMVMRPSGVAAGGNVSRLSSIKMKLFGAGFQASVLVAPGVLLTLSILRLNNIPDPFSGVKSLEKADRRRVLVVPGPGLRTLPDTFQLTPVSPAPCVGPGEEVRKVTTAE